MTEAGRPHSSLKKSREHIQLFVEQIKEVEYGIQLQPPFLPVSFLSLPQLSLCVTEELQARYRHPVSPHDHNNVPPLLQLCPLFSFIILTFFCTASSSVYLHFLFRNLF